MTVKNRLTETGILQRKIRNALILTATFIAVGIGALIGRFNTEGSLSVLLGLGAMGSAVVSGFFAISA